MVPSGSTFQGPDFGCGKSRLGADSAVVCLERCRFATAIIGADAPRTDALTVPQVGGYGIILVLTTVVIKSERTLTGCCRQGGIRNQSGPRVGRQIDALVRLRWRTYDLEAQECAHSRVAGTGKSLGHGYDIRGSTAVLVHLQVDQIHGLPGTVAGEINDDVIPLCDAKLVRLGQRNGDRQQVAVIRYLHELRRIAQ